MSKVKLLVLLIFIFLLGALAGSTATKIYIRAKIKKFVKSRFSKKRAILMRKLTHKLKLSKNQIREIENILDKSIRKVEILRRDYKIKLMKLMDETKFEIEEKLNENQKYKFNKMYEELKNRWLKRRKFPYKVKTFGNFRK